ncbi:hypothetical protein SELMODRAFT_98727 [Selaginella moellendorffii]|uniref:SKP1-like protein n=1 Tax=Selaginella moellendorffii TaxID=88036 RepID=D8RNY6_SELML|nr:SKP1-like protein 1A [Selaginella moellendorffii]EFJ26164.1 hypothetical protein SELMODRAFT_98727 [Selaginella moellendorffii]|eukprot:XP_002972943.1 SKP1-like protein 1A [Selaginella moellendorffii]
MAKVTLKSAEGDVFEVDEELALESLMVKNMIEDVGLDSAISLPNVSSPILAKVIEYIKFHMDAQKDGSKKTSEEIKAFDDDFVNVGIPTLFEMVLASNYLNVKSLLSLTCNTVANMIKTKPPAEVKEMFTSAKQAKA